MELKLNEEAVAVMSVARFLSELWRHLDAMHKENAVQYASRRNSAHQRYLDTALPELSRLAKEGHAKAQYYLALYLELKNSPAANVWLKQAADNGYSSACYQLGIRFYQQGVSHLAETYFLKLLQTNDSFLIDQVKAQLSQAELSQWLPKFEQALAERDIAPLKNDAKDGLDQAISLSRTEKHRFFAQADQNNMSQPPHSLNITTTTAFGIDR